MVEMIFNYDKTVKKQNRIVKSPYLLESFDTGMVSQ